MLGEEFDKVQFMVARLTVEHRDLEAVWKRLESGLKAVATRNTRKPNSCRWRKPF